jgi:activating signal cointegrator 1
MKALTIHQPYAELIARGDKRVENRTWRTRYRGPLAIHSGTSTARRLEAWQYRLDFDSLPLGAIVAVAQLTACIRVEQLRGWLSPVDDPHTEGPWCWVLADIERLAEPIRCTGQQALWTPPAEVTAVIVALLANFELRRGGSSTMIDEAQVASN